jgi:hypothetical protein
MRTPVSLLRALGVMAIAAATLLLASAWAMLALALAMGVLAEEPWSPYAAWIAMAPLLLAEQVLSGISALIIGGLLVLATSLGIVLLVRAIVRSRDAVRRRLLARTSLMLLAVAILTWSTQTYTLRAHRLAHVPPALEVTRILHAREQVWGFGPGGNEVSVIVYELPPYSAGKVREGGVAFLEGLRDPRPLPSRERDREYEGWAETPIRAGQHWTPRECEPSESNDCERPRLRHYLGSWGSMMGVDPDVERAVDEAVTRPGSYYGWARYGMLLVVPMQGRVYYLYQG